MDVVDAARRVAHEVLAPQAAEVDAAASIPRSHLAALADAGLFGLAGPAGVDAETRRAVMRILAAACGATTFVWAQHHGTTGHLVTTANTALRERWLDRCVRGEVLAGTAFAHVRRPGPPALLAMPTAAGWRLDGFAPWATSWGLAEVYSVAAAADAGRVVWLALDGVEARGLTASPPLDLSVMGATRTVELTFDAHEVPDDGVLSVEPIEAWRRPDRRVAARVNPGVLGVIDASLALVAARGSDEANEAHAALAADLADWERHDAELLDARAEPASLAEHRAAALDLAGRTTTAALSVAGGAGVHRDHPAQRLARERAFYVVQAQSSDGRSATLRRTRGIAAATTFSTADDN